MNFKQRKHKNKDKNVMDIWSFKRSFKLDYVRKNEFKKAFKNKTLCQEE